VRPENACESFGTFAVVFDFHTCEDGSSYMYERACRFYFSLSERDEARSTIMIPAKTSSSSKIVFVSHIWPNITANVNLSHGVISVFNARKFE